jgi:hypothetical protein
VLAEVAITAQWVVSHLKIIVKNVSCSRSIYQTRSDYDIQK